MIRKTTWWLVPSLLLLLPACPAEKSEKTPTHKTAETPKAAPPKKAVKISKEELAVFGQLPRRFDRKDNPINDAKVQLGRMLYYDARLSKNQDISCNTCHALDKFGVDPRGTPTSAGHKGQLGPRNSPTVYNAALHFKQFWDGRADTVEDQAKMPILNPVEMAMKDEKAVVKVLESIPEYVDLFKKAFPDSKDPVTFDNMAMAIGAFERGLMTPSRFDAFLAGNDKALTDDEKKGIKAFLGLGCQSCHNGVLLGGTTFMKLGLVEPWPDQADQGRYEVTKNDADRMMFKVPSLRNITETAPYGHAGKHKDLGEMIRLMARYQLGRKNVSDEDVHSMIAFFGALKGEIPQAYIEKPKLPASTPKTPKPNPN